MIRLYNTRQGAVESFIPNDSKVVTMYVCGPTVYDVIHVGNARSLVVFDVLFRLLKHTYPNVIYVRNITDVDDKIINRSKENNFPVEQLTRTMTTQLHKDCNVLGCLSPTIEPTATAHIDHMIQVIEKLLHTGYAYVSQGHVFFDVHALRDYSSFSNQHHVLEANRIEMNRAKKNQADFVLWKPAFEDDPIFFHSPWGIGRPGWHTECVAMSVHYLGTQFDIHGGGIDLFFPHHHNEWAQAISLSDSFATYWVHNGYVMSGGQKMSKSLGNFYTVRDVTTQHDGLTVRMYLLHTHYRKPLDFMPQGLLESKKLIERIIHVYEKYIGISKSAPSEEFIHILEDDLNTSQAMTYLIAHLSQLNTSNNPQLFSVFRGNMDVLGFDSLLIQKTHTPPLILNEEIQSLLTEREKARKNKHYTKADTLRIKIESKGYILEDTSNGVTVRKSSH